MLADIGRRSRGGTMARLGTILVDTQRQPPKRHGQPHQSSSFTAPRSSAGAVSALSDPVIYEAFTSTTAKCFRTRMTMSSTPTPCRAHTPRFRPYRTQDYAARSLPTPAFPGAIECRMGWGDLADAPFELVTHMGNTTRCKPDATYYLEQLQVMGLSRTRSLWWATTLSATSPVPPAAFKPPMLARENPAEPPGTEPWKTSPATSTP